MPNAMPCSVQHILTAAMHVRVPGVRLTFVGALQGPVCAMMASASGMTTISRYAPVRGTPTPVLRFDDFVGGGARRATNDW